MLQQYKDKVLEGTYVTLRPVTDADAENIVKWRNSAKAKYLHAGAASVQQQLQWQQSRPGNELNYIIELKDGDAVGMYAIYHVDDENKKAETGRLILSDSEKTHNVPVTFEAISLINDLAFSQLQLNKIYGVVIEDNKGVLKLQKLLGMKEEGRLRQHMYHDGKFQDLVYFGLLKEEYFSNQKKKLNNLIQLLHK